MGSVTGRVYVRGYGRHTYTTNSDTDLGLESLPGSSSVAIIKI